jgi:hypothetical protein
MAQRKSRMKKKFNKGVYKFYVEIEFPQKVFLTEKFIQNEREADAFLDGFIDGIFHSSLKSGTGMVNVKKYGRTKNNESD